MTDSFNADQGEKNPANAGSDTFNNEQAPTSVEFEVNGRKYNIEAAVKKITNADEHIQTLQEERAKERARMQELEAQVAKLNGINEVLARKQAADEGNGATTIDPEEVVRKAAEVVRKGLSEDQRVAQQQANLQEVKQALTKKYGSSVDDVVSKVITPLGMTKAEAFEMAKTKPKAYLALFERVAPPAPASTTSNVNTQSLKATPNEPAPRNLFTARSSKEQVDIYQERLQKKLSATSGGV